MSAPASPREEREVVTEAAQDDRFERDFRKAQRVAGAHGSLEPYARVLSGRLRDMDRRSRAANRRADEQQARADALARENERLRAAARIEFHQHDFIPGFAAFRPGSTTPAPDSKAFCVLNLGSILATVHTSDTPAADVPYFIAESMMHEVMHALEQWAGVEFSEERVEELLEKYRDAALAPTGASDAER